MLRSDRRQRQRELKSADTLCDTAANAVTDNSSQLVVYIITVTQLSRGNNKYFLSHNRPKVKCNVSITDFHSNKKYVLWNAGICPIASKVGQVTLATPPFGVIHHRLYTTSSSGSNRENTKSLAQNRNPRWRPSAILDLLRHHIGPPTKSFHWSTSACKILC